MQHCVHEKKASSQYRQLHRYQCLLIALSFLVIILFILVFQLIDRERTILLPLGFEDNYWVSHHSVSESYLQSITQQLAWLRLNLTPAIVDQQQLQFLQNVAPRYYATLQIQLEQEAETIKQQRITMSFYPLAMDINTRQLQVLLHGETHLQVADTTPLVQAQRYLIQYQLTQGRLWIKRFERLGDDDDVTLNTETD